MIAELPGAKIWYEDTGGNGAPLVLLHARTGSSRSWQYQFRDFPAAGYRVVAYDRRGSGRTEVDAGAGDVLPSDDLHHFVERLGLERFHLLGTAAGGIVALDFALSHPRRVRSLVFANSVGSAEIKQEPAYIALAAHLRPPDDSPAEMRELSPAYRAKNPQGTREWLEVERASRAKGAPTFPRTRNRITFSLLEKLEAPTLLITGDADLYTPPSALELFHQRIRNSALVVMPECAHSAYWEQPELFNRVVLDFLSGGAAS